MAHFAKLDDQNVVIEVNVVNNETLNNLEFPESEPVGVAFLTEWSGGHSNWKQTSYNVNFRKNYAGVGYKYDSTYDAFIPPQPFPSWTLDTELYDWLPPVSHPNDGKLYEWKEEILNWVEITGA